MPLLQGLDVLVLDALRRRPHPTHFNVEQAIDMAARMARRGLLIGWSAGAALVAAARVARELERGVVVAILPDGAERYLSDAAWDGEA